MPRRRVPARYCRDVTGGARRGPAAGRCSGGLDGAPDAVGRPRSAGAVEQPDVDAARAPSGRTAGRDRHPVARGGAGHRGGQPGGVRPAAARGQRRQLQRVLAGRRHGVDADLLDRGSAGRQDSAAVGRGRGAHRRRTRRAQPARPVRLARHLQRPQSVDPLHLARLERHRKLVQQQLPDLPGTGLRRRLPGADPRAADHPARRPSPMSTSRFASGWATRAGAGRETRSSSRPPTSPRRRTSAARATPCT